MQSHFRCALQGLGGWVFFAVLGGLLGSGSAHAGEASGFDPLQTFAPYQYATPVNRYRSANGMPGPDYWQNQVDYEIRATLDPDKRSLSAQVVIAYRNRSPDALQFLWLQLDQNRYRRDARANFSADAMPADGEHTRGYMLQSVEVLTADGYRAADYIISDTRMRVTLPQALEPRTGTTQLRIRYQYPIPGSFGGRTGWFHSRNGDVYEIAQWFPRLCVYDDLHGWNTLPFLNNEFYLEYGDIDYRVTLPAGMLMAGSGHLVNAEEVLPESVRQRLQRARQSRETVTIRSSEEVARAAAGTRPTGTRTWHFAMHDTRDVAFAASAAFIWDAARIDLPAGKTALAMSYYPVESIEGDSRWQHATRFVQQTVEFYSRQWFVYPWDTAVAVAGKVGGMEYPGLVFDWWQLDIEHLFGLTTHEIGHSWFPMIVGSNERRHAWMDEGINTFTNVLAHEAFDGGRFAPKRDGEFAPDGGNPVVEILPLLADPKAPPVLSRADAISEHYRHPVTYFKAALGLKLLRDVILGPQRFDSAFRQYVQAWVFKHPSPADFFRAIESAAGEDLSWFWRGWFRHNWQFDMAIADAVMVDDEQGRAVAVTLTNLDKMVFPAVLQVTWDDGSHAHMHIPVATWLQHRQFVVRVPAAGKVARSVQLDPAHKLPDADRDNNRLVLHPDRAAQ